MPYITLSRNVVEKRIKAQVFIRKCIFVKQIALCISSVSNLWVVIWKTQCICLFLHRLRHFFQLIRILYKINMVYKCKYLYQKHISDKNIHFT